MRKRGFLTVQDASELKELVEMISRNSFEYGFNLKRKKPERKQKAENAKIELKADIKQFYKLIELFVSNEV